MATNRLEQTPESEKGGAAKASTPVKSGGVLQNWLPVIITALLMPVLAYCMTMYIMLPKIQKSLGITATSESNLSDGAAGVDTGHGKGGDRAKQSFQLNKIIVNVSGSVGTRYLLGSYTLVGTAPDFKTKLENNKDQLLDIAASIMSTKTISDLEKPGARNLIRNELISAFNNALGGPYVKELYITEFAIQ